MNGNGLEPILRPPSAANDSALLLTLMAILAVNLLLAPTLLRLARMFFKQLMRTHREALPGERTLGERLVVIVGVVQTLVFEALMLYCAAGADEMPPLASVGGLSLLTLALFATQYCGYALTGYAFAPSGEDTRTWLAAMLITQACAGFLLIIPAMGALFYPGLLGAFVATGTAIYIAGRLPLYIRGFRIFYTSPASVVYFFLYLCTLEIVPVIGVLSLTGFFSSLFC